MSGITNATEEYRRSAAFNITSGFELSRFDCVALCARYTTECRTSAAVLWIIYLTRYIDFNLQILPKSLRIYETSGSYGVTVTDGVLVGEGVLVTVAVREGVAVLVEVGVRDGVAVEEAVAVGIAVGASPWTRNCPTTFKSSPTKIWTS